MKTLIIYMSVHHYNTEKIAKVIGESLKADLVDLNTASAVDISRYDTIGFGSGIYFGKPHRKIVQFINDLPAQTQKRAFVFSTSGKGIKQFNNLLESELSKKGFKMSENFACKGFDTWGPFALIGGLGKNRPNREDCENAKAFALTLKK